MAYLEDRKKAWGQDQKMSEKRTGSREGREGRAERQRLGRGMEIKVSLKKQVLNVIPNKV